MPCFNPLQAYFVCDPSGSRKVKFSSQAAEEFYNGNSLSEEYFGLPCGKCIGCRLERSRQWALRCMHEASLYEDNCFITLTYDDVHLPEDGSLNKKHFQDFMKRLRFKYSDSSIRYYHCGEYGEQFERPHYHALIFGFDFPDKVLWGSSNGENLYVSDSLTDLWGFGHCSIGDVTFESAAYVARYCTKLITGEAAAEHYQGRQPEYATMSRRPGIGRRWYDQFKKDAYPSDFLLVRGAKCKPPRYYDNRFSEEFPEQFQLIKDKRVDRSGTHANDNTYRRLKDREKCQEVRFEQLKRNLEISYA